MYRPSLTMAHQSQLIIATIDTRCSNKNSQPRTPTSLGIVSQQKLNSTKVCTKIKKKISVTHYTSTKHSITKKKDLGNEQSFQLNLNNDDSEKKKNLKRAVFSAKPT